METANAGRADRVLSPWLAGLKAGVLGSLAMLLWLGASAAWQRRTFWTSANLLATFFYGEGALSSGFTRATLAGLALYVLIYGILGALFAAVLASRAAGFRLAMIGILFGIGWYYLSFGLLWQRFSPLIPLLHAERPNFYAHCIYGGLLANFSRWIVRPAAGD